MVVQHSHQCLNLTKIKKDSEEQMHGLKIAVSSEKEHNNKQTKQQSAMWHCSQAQC